MLAVRLPAIGAAPVLADVPVPVPAGSEVLVRVAACGVCRTDLHIVRGEQTRVSPPVTLGHEISGWVESYGPEASTPPLAPGTPVVVYGGWGCGSCAQCTSGCEQRCAAGRSPGFQADGGWAEFVLVPSARYLVPLPPSVDPVRVAPLADAGVTPYRAVERARAWLRPGARVLVIGFGALGQFALQYLRRLPSLAVFVRDVNARKLDLARSLGASTAFVPAHASRASFDVVFDFVGTDATLADAAAAAAPGGLISIIGEGGGTLAVGFDSPAVEVWTTTTAWGSLDDLRAVVALAPELDWSAEPMPLRDYTLALDRLARGDVSGRIVLVP